MPYKVIKAPPGEGVVYTIAPVDDLQKVRHVRRDMLKPLVRPASMPPPVVTPPPPLPVGQTDPIDDQELCWIVPRGSPTSELPSMAPTEPPLPAVRDSDSEPPLEGGEGPMESMAPLSPLHQPTSSPQFLRRTGRTTAGQHSNPHHLPRTVGSSNKAID